MGQQDNTSAAERGAPFAPRWQWLQAAAQRALAAMLLATGLAHAAPVVTLITGPSSPAIQNQAVQITVVYDSPMDTAVAPAISFPTAGENALDSMVPTGASWLDASTFQQTYQTNAVVTTMPGVDVAVSGARDTSNELQVPALQADVFGLMSIPPPRVVDILVFLQNTVLVSPPGTHILTTADVGQAVQFFIRFDRATDYGGCGTAPNAFLCPNLTLPGVPGGTLGSLGNVQSQWLSRTLLRVTWTIAEGGDEFSNVDVLVPGGIGRRDDTSIKSAAQLFTGVFSIDTRRPTLAALVPSKNAIQPGDVGGSLALTATFSEPMDTSVAPTVAGVAAGGGAAVLTPTSGSWLDTTHYVQNFTIGNGAANAAIDIQVSGALDAHGNPQNVATVSGLFAAVAAQAVPALSPQVLLALAVLVFGAAAWGARRRQQGG